MLVWEQVLGPGDLFIDVGANVGTYSVLCARVGAFVIAVEPAPETAALLRQNVALNGACIEVVEALVGNEVGQARFTTGQDTVNRVDPAGSLTLPMTTLDQIIASRTVKGIKLDIEGFELEALRRAHVALREQRIGLLQLEWNDLADRRPIAELLSRSGYQLFAATARDRFTVALTPADPLRTSGDLFAASPNFFDNWLGPPLTITCSSGSQRRHRLGHSA